MSAGPVNHFSPFVDVDVLMTISHLGYFLASDVFIALLFPLLILVAGFKLVPRITISEVRDLLWPRTNRVSKGYFSLERAYLSYLQYLKLSSFELDRMRASYASLNRSNRGLGFKLGYHKKLDQLAQVTRLNALVSDGIAGLAEREFPLLTRNVDQDLGTSDLARVRESLKHFVRDWSSEGLDERMAIFTPILDVLKQVNPEDRGSSKVLVPGCGLGRLAWDISQLGFDTTANELSYFMTLALRFLLSPQTTKTINEHTLRPFAHWFSHQRSNESLFRPITFPDVIPRLSSNFRLLEQDFLTLKSPSVPTNLENPMIWHSLQVPTCSGGYDYIVTLFFIDTSIDVFATIKQIHTLLRPGGTWVNLGPLLWTSGGEAKVELSLDEVLQVAEEIGFVVQTDSGQVTSPRTVECEYTGNREAMMRWIYKAEFWVATKSK